MRPLLSAEAAAVVTGWQRLTGASASALVSQAVEACAATHEPEPAACGVLGMGARLRSARLARGWTQAQLGEVLKVTRALISHVERGGAANPDIVRWVLGEEDLDVEGPCGR